MATKIQPPNALRALGYQDLERLGYGSRPTIWRKVRSNQFPQPRFLGKKPVWLPRDIEEFMNQLPRGAAA